MSAQLFYDWNAQGACFLSDGCWGFARARQQIVISQAYDGAEFDVEKRAAKRRQARNSGERIADVPIHHTTVGWVPTFPCRRIA
jgi:hypothetical protein